MVQMLTYEKRFYLYILWLPLFVFCMKVSKRDDIELQQGIKRHSEPKSEAKTEYPPAQCEVLVQPEDLKANTGFYHKNVDNALNKELLSGLESNPDVYFLVFLGTWCGDSKQIIPFLFAHFEQVGISLSQRMTTVLVGFDKIAKGTALAQTFNIRRVPTVIVLRRGTEVGRVVEFGLDDPERLGFVERLDFWAKQLAEVLKPNPGSQAK